MAFGTSGHRGTAIRGRFHEWHTAAIVKLRYFGGLGVAESAAAAGISPRAVDRLWAYARAWLFARLQPSGDEE